MIAPKQKTASFEAVFVLSLSLIRSAVLAWGHAEAGLEGVAEIDAGGVSHLHRSPLSPTAIRPVDTS